MEDNKSAHQNFIERLRSENRFQEWTAALEKLKQEDPDSSPLANFSKARTMCGYLGAQKEQELALQRKLESIEYKEKIKAKEREFRNAEKEAAREFNELIAQLPLTAANVDELSWVGAHPLMRGRHFMKDKTKDIIVDADSITESIAGPAPSQRAVNLLQHFVNNPSEYYKQMVSEMKKSSDSEKNRAAAKDHTVEEINAILDSLEV